LLPGTDSGACASLKLETNNEGIIAADTINFIEEKNGIVGVFMPKVTHYFLVLCGIPLLLSISVFGAEQQQKHQNKGKQAAFKVETYSIKRDIAFVSVWGSRPDAEKLQGFKHAVLYNARGEVVQRIDMGRDSVYSLDKMIQENKARGPLFIRMYRR
jgi:hypothetical protein